MIRSDNRRLWERHFLPLIVEGDASQTARTVESLVRQGLIEPDTEHKLNGVIAALEALTRRAA